MIPRQALRNTRQGIVIVLGVGLLFARPGTAGAHNYLGSCTVNFDNTFALTYIKGNARDTFGYSTAYNSSGKLDFCKNAQFPGVCWTYRHKCAQNYVNVENISGRGHIHLSFSGPGYPVPICGFIDPNDGYGAGYGKLVNGNCVMPNWTTEPRVMNPHSGEDWTSIKMNPSGSMTTKKIFDLTRFQIGGTVPVQVWFHSTIDGGWYGWSSMSPNNWDTSAAAHDIDEVQFSGASGSANYVIEAFDILD